jgi:plastocyanin
VNSRRLLAAAFTVLALAGCSTSTTVGSANNLKGVKDQGQGRVGQVAPGASTTPTPHATTHAAPRPTQISTTRPPAARTTPPPATRQAATFRVRIVASAQGYDPVSFQVYKGTHVVVTNTDKVAHTFTSDNHAFDSGPIKAGASWTYIASRDGTFPFHDDTRPFASGQMQVYG